MEAISLDKLAAEKLAEAQQAHSGRSAHTIYGGAAHRLRQTLVALRAGEALAEHESPGESTLQVVRGRVRLTVGQDTWEGQTGDYVAIPPERHALDSLDDSVIILTVAKRESH